ncbi:hypothetical protein Ddye_023885 [Dipteronia dyeriana]|uniref:[RNA-polymerase]-subunit kinase n=1 Tax=Dipteronia dyeriana TaxID=168575 RepID=A0AAD9WTR6_9ROSI|nr:hypothetical protein Ddye_023885 [Dipteronia dyeriana]
MQVAREMAVLDSGFAFHNDHAFSLADDRETLWSDSEKPKPFISYHLTPLESSTKDNTLQSYVYEDERYASLISKVLEYEPCRKDTVDSVALDLLDDLSPIALKFDDAITTSIIPPDMKAYDVMKRDYSRFLKCSSLYQDYCSQLKLKKKVFACWYMALKLLFSAKQYDAGVDVQAAGGIFAELLNYRPFLQRTGDIDQLGKIFAALGIATRTLAYHPGYVEYQLTPPLHSLFPTASDDALDLLSKMLTYDPNAGITAQQALEPRQMVSLLAGMNKEACHLRCLYLLLLATSLPHPCEDAFSSKAGRSRSALARFAAFVINVVEESRLMTDNNGTQVDQEKSTHCAPTRGGEDHSFIDSNLLHGEDQIERSD